MKKNIFFILLVQIVGSSFAVVGTYHTISVCGFTVYSNSEMFFPLYRLDPSGYKVDQKGFIVWDDITKVPQNGTDQDPYLCSDFEHFGYFLNYLEYCISWPTKAKCALRLFSKHKENVSEFSRFCLDDDHLMYKNMSERDFFRIYDPQKLYNGCEEILGQLEKWKHDRSRFFPKIVKARCKLRHSGYWLPHWHWVFVYDLEDLFKKKYSLDRVDHWDWKDIYEVLRKELNKIANEYEQWIRSHSQSTVYRNIYDDYRKWTVSKEI